MRLSHCAWWCDRKYRLYIRVSFLGWILRNKRGNFWVEIGMEYLRGLDWRAVEGGGNKHILRELPKTVSRPLICHHNTAHNNTTLRAKCPRRCTLCNIQKTNAIRCWITATGGRRPLWAILASSGEPDRPLSSRLPKRRRPSGRRSVEIRPCCRWTPLVRCSKSSRSSWRRPEWSAPYKFQNAESKFDYIIFFSKEMF